jgi:hypothetical protein
VLLNASGSEPEWRSWTTSEDVERAAGELRYARVWNVQRPVDADA